MASVIDFTVRSYDQDFLELWWTLGDAPGKVSRSHIFIDRCVDGPAGPWVQIAGPFYNTDHFRDGDVDRFHVHRRHYYQLRILDKDTDSTETFGPFSEDAKPDIIAEETRRHFTLLMQEYGGRRLVIFPVITKGFRCPVCILLSADGRGTGRRRIQNCIDCYEIGYVGGFAAPIAVFGQLDVEVKNLQPTDTGPQARETTTARVPFFPPLKPGDMIVEAENVRWEVQSLRSTKKGRAISHQEPVLIHIPPSDIRYKVPVNVDPRNEASPPREFTRPMCLPDSESESIGGLATFLDSLVPDAE